MRLPGTGGGASADVIDVTPGTPARTLRVMVAGDELLFDGLRFQGGHVYHVQLRRGSEAIGSAFVYLYPEAPQLKDTPRGRQPTKVQFAPKETVSDERDDQAIRPVVKRPL